MSSNSESTASDSFWNFSCHVYQKPFVAEHCLVLQDEYALNVNYLLLCCWLGSQGRVFSADTFRQLISKTSSWDKQLIGVIRALRRRVKTLQNTQDMRLYQALLDCELVAEKIEQSFLQLTNAHYSENLLSLESTVTNFKNYCSCLDVSIDMRCIHLFADLLELLFDEIETAEIDRAITGFF